MSKQSLTPLQRKAFFMALRPAAQEVGEEPEVYRKRILNEELGVEHLGEVESVHVVLRRLLRIEVVGNLCWRVLASEGVYPSLAVLDVSAYQLPYRFNRKRVHRWHRPLSCYLHKFVSILSVATLCALGFAASLVEESAKAIT